MKKPKRLGESLVEAGLINETQLNHALERQKQWGGRLGSNLVMAGILKERELLRFLAKQTGVQEVNLTYSMFSRDAVKKLPQKLAEQYNVVPVRMKNKSTLVVAMVDPTDLNAVDQVQFATGNRVEPVLASHSSIANAINHFYAGVPLADLGPKDKPFSEDDEEDYLAPEHQGGVHQAIEDPDLIIFGEQSLRGMEPLQPRDADQQAQAATYPQPVEHRDEDEFTLDFSSPAENPSAADVSDQPKQNWSMTQRFVALYRVLVKKGMVSEAEVMRELVALRSRGRI